MARKYSVILASDEADYLRDTIAPIAPVEITNFSAGEVTATFGETAKNHLESLPEDSDGHIDNDGNLWIMGSDYPVSVLHNA